MAAGEHVVNSGNRATCSQGVRRLADSSKASQHSGLARVDPADLIQHDLWDAALECEQDRHGSVRGGACSQAVSELGSPVARNAASPQARNLLSGTDCQVQMTPRTSSDPVNRDCRVGSRLCYLAGSPA